MEGHSACIVQSSLILFGGKNFHHTQNTRYINSIRVIPNIADIVSGREVSAELEILMVKPCPQGRAYHIACAYKKNFMIVLGGMIERVDQQHHCMRLIDIFDTQLRRWHHVVAKGDIPSSRIHHASAVSGDTLFIQGGYPLEIDEKGKSREFASHHILGVGNSLFDIYMLNLETMFWRRLTFTGLSAPLLWGHSAVFFANNLLFFGGVDVSKSKEVGDITIWNINKKCCLRAICPCPIASAMHQCVTVGRMDTNRSSHMYVLGGVQFSTKECVNDLRRFDLQKGEWSIVKTEGDIPVGRIGHSFLALDETHILLIGGVQSGSNEDWSMYVFDISTQNWKRISLKDKDIGSNPASLTSHKSFPGFTCHASDFEEKKYSTQSQDHPFGVGTSHVGGAPFDRKERDASHEAVFSNKQSGDSLETIGSNIVSYDAPPPLPTAEYTAKSAKNRKNGGLDIFNTTSMYGNENNFPRKLKESPHCTTDEASFQDLGPLFNVSLFLGNVNDGIYSKKCGNFRENIDQEAPEAYVSSCTLQKMINSALHREESDDLPEHRVNFQPSEDPLKYLHATSTVRRWQRENTS